MITAETEADFVAWLGDLYEHSPWIVRAVWPLAPFDHPEAMIEATSGVVLAAGEEKQRALVCAHPELARKFGVDPDLGALSAQEQAGAGLDRLTQAEFESFRRLNDAYRERFGMPFVICVREAGGKGGIHAALERRITLSAGQELAEALRQIDRIAALRLNDKLAS